MHPFKILSRSLVSTLVSYLSNSWVPPSTTCVALDDQNVLYMLRVAATLTKRFSFFFVNEIASDDRIIATCDFMNKEKQRKSQVAIIIANLM